MQLLSAHCPSKQILAITALLLVACFAFASNDAHHDQAITQGLKGTVKKEATQIMGARFLDTDGTIRRMGDDDGAGPIALVFVDEHCPISARYLGELNTIAAQAQRNNIDFYAIVSNPKKTWSDVLRLRDDYALSFPVLFDPSGDLAHRLNPVATAEAFVINEQDQMIYRGRIDDRFAGFGQLRKVIRNHDLLKVFEQAKSISIEPKATEVIGCFFEAWERSPNTKVDYYRDIEPIIAANCVECHQAGGVAPFPLESFEDASLRAGLLAHITKTGLMPPWRPKPQFGRFRDERYLSTRQIELFSKWAEHGAKLGDAKNQAPRAKLPDPGWRLGQPDLVLEMLEPFDVPASGEDIYRYFVIPSGLLEDKTIKAIDFRPGDPKVVHHANFFADYDGRARSQDARDNEPGFSVFGTGEFMSYDNTDQNAFGIGGWAPGAEPYSLPKEVGLWLPKGADIVIEIHYKLNGKQTKDQSQIGLYFRKHHAKEYIDGLLVGTQELDIPAGGSRYVRHVSMDVPADFRLVDIMPHMHYIGSRARVVVTYPDGSKHSVIGIEDWDLRWQNIYVLRSPLAIPAGSSIDFWFEWDNSDKNFDNPFNPPKRLGWGWKSEDEMAEVWLGIIPDDPNRRLELIEAANKTWYNVDSEPLPK